MSQTLLDLAQELTRATTPFVLATVVWCERPTSAKPGAKALIREDGSITGWIGGSCAQPVVIREALRVLREGGDAYLLRLGAQDTGVVRNDVRVFPMTCTSGGVLDIYIEPHLPVPQLVLVGDSPVIQALSQLAPVLDFAVTQLDQPDLSQVQINERTLIVVATHGQYDEDALEQALRSPALYIGMVASHRRADACREYLHSSGITDEQLAHLKAPAGVDVGAVTPAEIASSILAELVQVRRSGHLAHEPQVLGEEHTHMSEPDTGTLATTAIDPICGMEVEIANARHHVHHNGQDFYFCCPACKRHFERSLQEQVS